MKKIALIRAERTFGILGNHRKIGALLQKPRGGQQIAGRR